MVRYQSPRGSGTYNTGLQLLSRWRSTKGRLLVRSWRWSEWEIGRWSSGLRGWFIDIAMPSVKPQRRKHLTWQLIYWDAVLTLMNDGPNRSRMSERTLVTEWLSEWWWHMDGRSQHLVSLWHFCVFAYGLDGYNGHLLGTMAIWNGFWSGMDQVFDWCGSSYSWLQVAGMTSKSSAALGFAMAVRCCRFLIGGSLWSAVCNGCWVFCLTGLTSKGGMEGYEPGWCQFDQTDIPESISAWFGSVFGMLQQCIYGFVFVVLLFGLITSEFGAFLPGLNSLDGTVMTTKLVCFQCV